MGILCLEGKIFVAEVFDDGYVWEFCVWRERGRESGEESDGKVTRERERERERERDQICGEKKIIKYKMQMNSNYINIHGYCSNFEYLENFSLTDVKDFWGKMCQICYLLYLAKFYKG